MDLNPRALRFTAFSAALHGRLEQVTVVHGDLLQGHAVSDPTGLTDYSSLPDLLRSICCQVHPESDGYYDMVTANPPFLPVPDESSSISSRYGLFSAGGTSGESVLAASLELSNELLRVDGYAAIVSEFFFQDIDDLKAEAVNILLEQPGLYWTKATLRLAERRCFLQTSIQSRR